jgi:hypothetical protein
VDAAAHDCRNLPGQREAGREHWHFLGHGCRECDAHSLAGANLGTVQDWYRVSRISQAWFEAYMYLWTTSAHRYGSYSDWTPVDDEVRDLVEAIHDAHKQRTASAA